MVYQIKDFEVLTHARRMRRTIDESLRSLDDILDERDLGTVYRFKTYTHEVVLRVFADIFKANAIYPKNDGDFQRRRSLQTEASGYLEALIEECRFISVEADIPSGQLDRMIESISREVSIIKRWRQTDAKAKRYIS